MRGVAVLAAMTLLTLMSSGCFVSEDKPEPEPTGTATSSASSTNSTASGNATPPATNHAPSVNLTVSPANGSAPLNVTFTITGNDTDGDALQWTLMLGNETIGNGTGLPGSQNHTFAQAGNYTVSVRVDDGTVNVTANVTVIVATAGPAGPTEDAYVVFNLDGTCDAKGERTIGPVHVHDRADSPPEPGLVSGGGTWVYEESNGIAGLQVGGDAEDTPYKACLKPDTLIF